MGGKGEGKVDEKKLKKDRDEWGNLPPKEIAKAKNLMNRKLPPNYAELVKAYKKALAKRTVKGEGEE